MVDDNPRPADAVSGSAPGGAAPIGVAPDGTAPAGAPSPGSSARAGVLDLRGISYETFEAFLFERPVAASTADADPPAAAGTTPAGTTPAGTTPAGTTPADTTPAGSSSAWWHHLPAVVHFEPALLLSHYLRLFAFPQALATRYTPAQLDHGFWFVQNEWSAFALNPLLWSTDAPWQHREAAVRAMLSLHAQLFSTVPLPLSTPLWWDSLCYAFRPPPAPACAAHPDFVRLQDVLFDTAALVLELPHAPCRHAALQGLRHLRHPRTREVLEGWQATHDPEHDLAVTAFAVAWRQAHGSA